MRAGRFWAGAAFPIFFLAGSITLALAQPASADDGVIYSVTHTDNRINRQDASTGALQNSFVPPVVAQGGGGNGLAASASELFYSTINSANIYRLNPATGAVLGSFPAPAAAAFNIDALGYGVSSFGPTLFAGDYNNSRIYLLNPASGAVFNSYTPPYNVLGGMDFDSATNRLWTTDDTGIVYSTNPETGAVISSFPTGGGTTNATLGIGLVSGRLFTSTGTEITERNKATGAAINSFSSANGEFISALAGIPEPGGLALLAITIVAALRRRPVPLRSR